jgi:hypothetical protein
MSLPRADRADALTLASAGGVAGAERYPREGWSETPDQHLLAT